MSEPSAELDELRRRIDEQSQRIEELQDALHTLSIAVQYRKEEPYLAFQAEHGITGRRRIALNGGHQWGCCLERRDMCIHSAPGFMKNSWKTTPP